MSEDVCRGEMMYPLGCREEGESMPSSPDEYELLEEVGKGATASVWLARVKATGLKVAIKLVDLEAQGNGMVLPTRFSFRLSSFASQWDFSASPCFVNWPIAVTKPRECHGGFTPCHSWLWPITHAWSPCSASSAKQLGDLTCIGLHSKKYEVVWTLGI